MSVPCFISQTLYNLHRLSGHSTSSNRLFVSLLGSFLFMLTVLSGCRQKTEGEQNQKEVASQEQSTGSLSAQSLREASLQGNMQQVQRAIKQDIDVNASDPAGRNALMLASYNGHYKIVQLLLKEGATVDDRNAEGRTALIFAASGPFPDTVALLLEEVDDPNTTGQIAGWSALMFASAEGHQEVAEVLLDSGADPTLKDKDNDTALDFARNNNHQAVVSLWEESDQ